MKFNIFLTIIFVLTIQLTSKINQEKNSFSNSFNLSIENKAAHESIYEIIKSTNGNIFTHMRSVKEDFHPEIQHIFERTIKDYEYRYITDKEEFVEFMFDRYQDLEYFEKNNKKEIEEKYKEETFNFLKQIVKVYHKLNEKQKRKFLDYVESQDVFTKKIIDFGIKNHLAFDDSKFKDLETIIQTIPEMIFSNQDLNKIKKIKGKININGEEIKHGENKIKKEKKITYTKIKNNKNNFMKNSTNPNSDENRKKEFSFTPPSTIINKNFTSFIKNITSEYNLTHLHKESHPTELKKLINENLSTSIHDNHRKSFSIFLQEYIKEAAYNNDMSLVKQFNEHNDEFIENFDLLRFKAATGQEDIDDEKTSKKSSDSTGDQGMDVPKPELSTMQGSTEVATTIVAKKVGKGKVKELLRQQKAAQFGQGQTCENQEEQVKELLVTKAEEIKDKQEALKSDLAEIPKDILNIGGDADGIPGILKSIIVPFVGKIAGLVASQIPFYFFKFCIPPGPLTFGCCPEASFFPMQIYNLFTIFDKVEKFKTLARDFPNWLQTLTFNEFFPQPLYYICAQSYLTVQMSANFNMCDPRSLIWTNPMTWMGLLPGDFPVCYVACIQAMITCMALPWEIAPCDSLINIYNLISAIFDISARFRLMGTFIGTCTYIPFLIRWDLLSSWKPENQANYDDPLAKPIIEPNCDVPEKEPKSPFEEELIRDGIKPPKIIPILPIPEKGERGKYTKKSSFAVVNVDINAEPNIGRIVGADSPFSDSGGYPKDFVYMISNYGDFSSEEKRKRFPFHVKTYIINQK